jgi:hypothetical protein
MRLLLLICLAATLAVVPAAAAAPLMVVDRGGEVLRGPKQVALKKRTARVGSRRCSVAARTPLSVLLAAKLPLRLRDYGACGRDVRDSGSLYVVAVAGQRERGRGGWVYKLGRRAPGTGAADPISRVRPRTRVLWFWCEQDSAGGCQRTLEVKPERPANGSVRVTVRGYDDNGRGLPVAAATVRLGSATATTDAQGQATLPVPAGGGRVFASKPGLVRSFPVRVSG